MKAEVRKIITSLLVNFTLVTYRGEFGGILPELPPISSLDPTYGIKRNGFDYVQDGVMIALAPPSIYAFSARN